MPAPHPERFFLCKRGACVLPASLLARAPAITLMFDSLEIDRTEKKSLKLKRSLIISAISQLKAVHTIEFKKSEKKRCVYFCRAKVPEGTSTYPFKNNSLQTF
jgi:hypothetical protein